MDLLLMREMMDSPILTRIGRMLIYALVVHKG